MKRNSKHSKHTNGKDLYESAKTKIPSLQLLPRHSTESPTIPDPTMSSSRDLAPQPGLNRLPSLTVSAPLPPLPAAWEGTEDMKMWLHAKIEEDRRKQQEEMKQQANLILEQRRIEQSILSDALRAGVPPKLVPLIFNGIYTTGVDELQRQCSAPASRTATPSPMSRQHNKGLAPSKKLPIASKPPRRTPRQTPKRPTRPKASELSPTATSHIPETHHSRWSEDMSNQHRERMISSERERLKRKLNSQNIKVADQKLLDTAFEHTFPVTKAMIQDLPPRYLIDPPDRASETQESERQQSRSQPQQQLQMLSNPVSVSKAPSHLRPEQTNPPSPKRKDQRSHKKVHPPQYHRNEILLAQHDPFHRPELDQKPQQRDLSSANDPRTCEGGSSEKTTDSTLASVVKSSDSS
ncbi:hypothetical protein N7517_002513 [Penicillium concentricum]|uniref:Uncharacterized protein n=1 Tax=Penicillium concentricum TaxID=293559 RepID=A0A9W9STZ0_9EURO|nr:uncharacterized protein N7517_002513 [Penicillium concentricum]KAJ5384602.1 hypothetical protein N7517_002513 [Penicillium concentricum]